MDCLLRKRYYVLQNGARKDWDYVQEAVIASGFTEDELIESAKEYVWLCGMSLEEYFKEKGISHEQEI
jgi:hypothetical protein